MRLFNEGLSNFAGSAEDYDDYEGARLRRRTRNWIYHRVRTIAQKEWQDSSSYSIDELSRVYSDIESVLDLYLPNIDPASPKTLKMWTSGDARVKGKKARMAMKTGRALRLMFPSLTDAEVDEMVTDLRNHLFPKQYNVTVSGNAAVFKKAYAGDRAEYDNVDTSWRIKHIANSCMRYEFASQPRHPAEAYASGDFRMVMLTDDNDLVVGRVVLCLKGDAKYAGPMYVCNQQAVQQFETMADDEGWIWADGGEWNGAKLLALPYQGGFQAPYIDIQPRNLQESDCGKFLVIDRYGDIDASQYHGILTNSSRCRCAECEDTVSEYDVHVRNDIDYCSDCFHELYFHCENCDEYEPNHEATTVNVENRWGCHEQTWCEHCVGDNAIETDNGELWHCDSVCSAYVDGEEVYVSNQDLEEGFFICFISGNYYENDLSVELDNGELAAMGQVFEYNAADHNDHFVWDMTENHWRLEPRNYKEQAIA